VAEKSCEYLDLKGGLLGGIFGLKDTKEDTTYISVLQSYMLVEAERLFWSPSCFFCETWWTVDFAMQVEVVRMQQDV
jgi:hypothetical protein